MTAGAEPAAPGRSALPLPLVALLAGGLAFAAFGPMLGSWFVRDDFVWLHEARQGLAWRSYGYLRPVSNLFFWVEHALFGLDARGYYAVALLLHVWNALWLGAFTGTCLRDRRAGIVAALLFAVISRPATSVHWISGLVTLVPVGLGLPALWAHLRYLRGGGVFYAVLAFAGVVLAVGAKESGAVFGLVLLALEVRERGWRGLLLPRTWLRYAPYAAVAAAYVLVQARFVGNATTGLEGRGVFEVTTSFAVAALAEVPLLLVPSTTSPEELRGPLLGLSVLAALLAAARLLGGSAGLRRASFLVLVLGLAFVPFVSFLVGAERLAGRYGYIPSAFAVALLASVLVLVDVRLSRSRALRILGLAVFATWLALHVHGARRSVTKSPRFRVQGEAARRFTDGFRREVVPRLAEPTGGGDPQRFAIVGAPFETERQLACLASVFFELPIEAVTEEKLDFTSAAFSDRMRTNGEPYLRTRFGVDGVFVFTSGEGLVPYERGWDRDGFRMWHAMVLNWRKPGTWPNTVSVFLVDGRG